MGQSFGRGLTSMSAGAASLVLVTQFCCLPVAPALADGGRGGDAHHGSPVGVGIGGAGGADGLPGAPGTDAAASSASGGGGGGGGGAGGAPGGLGGHGDTFGSLGAVGGDGGAGGAGGANTQSISQIDNAAPIVGGVGQSGGAGGNSNGGPGADGGGGGGGGSGGHALVVTGTAASSNGSALTGGVGGAGGSGGTGAATGGNGGNGGDGGAGLKLGGSGIVFTNTGTIQGGLGGVGGLGANGSGRGGIGGNGGAGGVGVLDVASHAVLINAGVIRGGDGSIGGLGGSGIENGASGAAGAGGIGISGADLTVINSGTISGGRGNLGAGAQANAVVFTGGTNILEIQAGASFAGNVVAFSSADTLRLGGATDATFDVSQVGSLYQGFGVFRKTGASTWTLVGSTAALTPWSIDQGVLSISSDAALGSVSGKLSFNGGVLRTTSAISTTRDVALNSGGGTFQADADLILGGTISGQGSLTKSGAGTLVLAGSSTYQGATAVNAGRFQAGAANSFSAGSAFTVASGAVLDLNSFNQTVGSLAGAGAVALGSATLTTGGDGTSTTFSGSISGSGGLTKSGAGTLVFTGSSGYTGATNINGGVLQVDGAITSSSAVNVSVGGTLTGTGLVDPPNTVSIGSGATLAPGNATPGSSMTIAGNLAFQSGALYVVNLNPATASFANVTGTAALGGATVNAIFANGSYVAKQYSILTASGGVSGTFAGPVNTNLPAGFSSSLSYDGNHAFLNLVLNFTGLTIPGGLNANQQAVGNALSNSFASVGTIPLVFGALTPAGLTQASGELATGSQQTTFDAMNLFVGLLTDPFMARNGGNGSAGGATGYAEDAYAAASRRTDAFAMVTKAPPRLPVEPRWSVWVSGFGGSQSTDGSAATGSNNTTSRIYGTAVGVDYLISPNTLAGFALAGGGTNFSVNGLGSGRSDLFQAGAYVRHTNGPTYLTAALAYGWQDITTDRFVTIAGVDHLRAEFNANAWSGRIEGGYRFVLPWAGGIGITPYAAGQFTSFELPGYAETAVSGASAFALAYNAKSVTDSRSELGLRADRSFAMQDGILTLRGRAAWAHDFNPDRSIAATFQTLPGASFVVNGAAQAFDSALATASAEMKWINGWSAAATFEGEFSNVTQSYAGKGTLRYTW